MNQKCGIGTLMRAIYWAVSGAIIVYIDTIINYILDSDSRQYRRRLRKTPFNGHNGERLADGDSDEIDFEEVILTNNSATGDSGDISPKPYSENTIATLEERIDRLEAIVNNLIKKVDNLESRVYRIGLQTARY